MEKKKGLLWISVAGTLFALSQIMGPMGSNPATAFLCIGIGIAVIYYTIKMFRR